MVFSVTLEYILGLVIRRMDSRNVPAVITQFLQLSVLWIILLKVAPP